VDVPVIASGGAGGAADMAAALAAGAQAALAASIFHDGETTMADVKQEVAACGLPIRL
jgi:imidazole glycerol-phosphate synthase subunit HisF